jgi:HSP20 family protein
MYRTLYDELIDLNRRMSRLFNDYTIRDGAYPETNVYENGEEYVIIAKLPGLTKKDVEISFKDSTIKITGERKADFDKKESLLLRERYAGKFERSFVLNEQVSMDNVKAEFNNGLLMIKLPKAPESKPRKIEIK